jgi:hypothetical protein
MDVRRERRALKKVSRGMPVRVDFAPPMCPRSSPAVAGSRLTDVASISRDGAEQKACSADLRGRTSTSGRACPIRQFLEKGLYHRENAEAKGVCRGRSSASTSSKSAAFR